jgi:hypothetical protein
MEPEQDFDHHVDGRRQIVMTTDVSQLMREETMATGLAVPMIRSRRRSVSSSRPSWTGEPSRMTTASRRQRIHHVRRITAHPRDQIARSRTKSSPTPGNAVAGEVAVATRNADRENG